MVLTNAPILGAAVKVGNNIARLIVRGLSIASSAAPRQGARAMMGTKERAFAPRCNRSLEELVPVDSFYRVLEAKLNLDFVRDWSEIPIRHAGDHPSIRGSSSSSSS